MSDFLTSLEVLQKRGRYRKRLFLPHKAVDFASNDYLGLKSDKQTFHKACRALKKYGFFSPASSQLVYGYQSPHIKLERLLTTLHGFEDTILLGSGFMANHALVSTLGGRRDTLFMDEEYHASGIGALPLSKAKTILFRHNDANDLRQKLIAHGGEHNFIFIESVYSMIGDVAPRDLFSLADEFDAYLVIDEAHGFGVIGDTLKGIFEYYDITPHEKHIKMGTLSKAVGSYGAYICATKEVTDFLINRARALIYSTAPSLFDVTLARKRIQKIQTHAAQYRKKLDDRLHEVNRVLGISCKTPIIMIENRYAPRLHESLHQTRVLTGLIRPPTIPQTALRLIARLGEKKSVFTQTLKTIERGLC